jgi:hypothetical protein
MVNYCIIITLKLRLSFYQQKIKHYFAAIIKVLNESVLVEAELRMTVKTGERKGAKFKIVP